MTWRPDEVRHALVMSYHCGGLYAIFIGLFFWAASSNQLMALSATLMCFLLVGAAILVDGDLTMVISTAPPVVIWTVLGTIGTLFQIMDGSVSADLGKEKRG